MIALVTTPPRAYPDDSSPCLATTTLDGVVTKAIISQKICPRHPELSGKRQKNGWCSGCSRDRDKARRATPEYRAKNKIAKTKMLQKKRDSVGTRCFGKVCEKHPELNGKRMTSNHQCVSCKNEKRHARIKNQYHSDPEWREKYLLMKAEQKARYNRYGLYAANYRAAKKQRTPPWADMEKIKAVYAEAARLGMEVDHIIPLQGGIVSGFHIETNLRIITQKENDVKSNKLIEALL